MSTVKQEQELIDNALITVKAKLRANSLKSTWNELDLNTITSGINEEYYELFEALDKGKHSEIVFEATDLICYCMMLIHHFTKNT